MRLACLLGALILACSGWDDEAGAPRTVGVPDRGGVAEEPEPSGGIPRPEAEQGAPAPTSETDHEPSQATATHGPEPRPRDEALPSLDEILRMDGSTSRSVRGPNDGALEGGVPLPLRGPGFRFNPRRDPRARYGTIEVVRQLVAAAAVVHQELPGGQLTINDLSLPQGGPIPHHGSHQSGRDADVLFYLIGPNGEPHPSVGAPLDPQGRGTDYGDLADPNDDVPLRIDLPRTWRFLQALIEGSGDDEAPLQRVFVAEHLRTLLVDYAQASGAPAATRARFAMITCQPSYPHDDHLHLRWFCSPDDLAAGCEDTPPHYPWRRRALEALGLELRRHRPRPDRPRAPITTSAQARAAAGPMHPEVRRFLRRRRAWMDPPHPGRPFCR